ncbi:MAG: zinc-ribbon and FHA domain-containing protein [Actinomycetota bacterium]|nr:zinc-ribbon and FHA domain-containing protein [Actinomycetota bacterium]
MPFCTECGHQNPASARFCSHCGHRLEQPVSTERHAESTASISFPAVDADGERHEIVDPKADLSADDAAAVDALPPQSALLVVQRGPSAGSRFLLDTDEVTAGRHPDSDIFLDDVTVSRRHALFRRTPDGYVVADVGSLNGTYVNRDRIDEILLSGGDEVQIGKFRLVYFASQHATGRAGR